MRAIYSRLKANVALRAFVVSYVPNPIIHFIRYFFDYKTRKFSTPIKVPTWYESRLAPIISIYLCWIFWPLYKYFKWRNYEFIINNISTSPGHIIVELDWMLRDIIHNRKSLTKKYIVIWPQSEVAHGAAKEFSGRTFPTYIVSTCLYIFALPFLMRFEDLVEDYGLSSVVLHKINKESRGIPFNVLNIKSLVRCLLEEQIRYKKYYSLRRESQDLFPLRHNLGIDEELRTFLGADNAENYVLIQIKTNIQNGTLKPTDAKTYIPSIIFLKKLGYKIIFIGREKMPSEFEDLDLINYSEWYGSSFSRDLQLVSNARLGITSASGLANLFDVIGTPLVYSNQWNFVWPPPGRSTVSVPTLLGDNSTKILWPFEKQIAFFYQEEKSDYSGGISSGLMIKNASGIEILHATKEALALGEKYVQKSHLQMKFQAACQNPILSLAESRISQKFIEKYQTLLQ